MQTLRAIMLILAFLLLLASCESAMDSGLINCRSDSDCGEGLICNNLTGECVEDAAGDSDGDLIPDGDNENTSDGDSDAAESSESEDTCSSISTNPSELDFGCVFIGAIKQKSLLIINNSQEEVPLEIFSVEINSLSADFQIITDVTLPATLLRGQTMELEVSYSPVSINSETGSIVISSDACDNPKLEIPLSANVDCCSADIGIHVTPRSHNFGDVTIGDFTPEKEFVICNTAKVTEASEFCALTVTQIVTERVVWDNFKCITDTCVTPQVDPLRILPGEQNCESFTIMYSPQDMGEHGDTVLIFNDSDTPGDRIYKVDINGSASKSCIFLLPYPVGFGSAVVGETREIIATLHNSCKNDVTINLISKVELEDDDCDMFSLGEDVEDVQGSILPANNVQPAQFNVKYSPEEAGKHTCHIDVASSLEGADHMQFPMQGKGFTESQLPVAVVSLTSHGEAINAPIENVPADGEQTWKFYGDSSYDPDAEDPENPILKYEWSMLEWPAESETTLHPFGSDGMNVYTQFDVGGTYRFQLDVWDMKGLKNDEPFIVTVNAVEE